MYSGKQRNCHKHVHILLLQGLKKIKQNLEFELFTALLVVRHSKIQDRYEVIYLKVYRKHALSICSLTNHLLKLLYGTSV